MQLTNAARSAAADAVVDLIDVGTGEATGDLQITQADGTTILATFDAILNPAFGAASNGVATLNGLPITVAAGAAGTAALGIFRDRDGTEIFRASVTGTDGAGEIQLQQTGAAISAGQDVTITAFTYTQPAGSV